MGKIRINGYCDPLNVKSGDEIDFMISAENTEKVSSKIVRLVHGDENPLGPGFIENELLNAIDSKSLSLKNFKGLVRKYDTGCS